MSPSDWVARRRHRAFGAAGHHETDIARTGPQVLVEHQRETVRREAAREIVDKAIAFGLAEHRDDAGGIDALCGDRRFDPAHVVGRVGGDAVDFGRGHCSDSPN